MAFEMTWWDANAKRYWNTYFHALQSLEKGHIFPVDLAEHFHQGMQSVGNPFFQQDSLVLSWSPPQQNLQIFFQWLSSPTPSIMK